MKEQRRLAAIVAADVVGYSRLMGRDEGGTLSALKAARRDIVDPRIAAHGGRIVKTTGDGLLLEFASVVEAVRCVVEVQDAMHALGVSVPEDRRIVFRIGVNLGDIIIEGDDIFGDGVNVAARLQEIAPPGGICVSSRVHDDVRDRLGSAFDDGGERTLKNIARPVRVWSWSPGERAPSATPPLALPDKPSIAVLPFQNMSGDPEQEYFADGMSEDVITELTRFRSLFVIARNSSFSYKGKSPDVRDVGRELGVRYVLEGSVRKAADRVRLTSQLIDAQTGNHIWAERYDRQLDDVFAVQEELTRNIVRAIAPHISEAELARVKRRRPESLSAYEIAVRAHGTAMDAFARSDARMCEEALSLASAALAIDPDSVTALHARAIACWQHYIRGTAVDRRAAWRDGLAASERMIEIDRSFSNAYMLKGSFLVFDRRFEDGLASARQGHELNPHDMVTLLGLAFVEDIAGDPERSIAVAREALRLSPRDPLRPYLLQQLTLANFAVGRYAEAIECAKRGIAEAPALPPLHIYRAASHAALGRHDEARAAFVAARRAGPEVVDRMLSGDLPRRDREAAARLTRFLRIAGGLDAPPAAAGASTVPLALPDKPSIAVLPFQNMSGDPEQEYFADGMVEDIITALSRFKSLFVIARNSSFTYKGKAIDIKRVGRELGVRYVLEGSVRKAGERVRITGQLVDAATGTHLWAQRFDGSLEDVFRLQDEVTSSVASAIGPTIERAEMVRASRKPTAALDAYDLYLQGLAEYYKLAEASMASALDLFSRAATLDPDFARPCVMVSVCFALRRAMGWTADIATENAQADEWVRRALRLDSRDPYVLSRAACVLAYVLRRVEESRDLVDRSLELDPNDAFAWGWSGWIRLWLGDPDDAIRRFGWTLRLNPLDPQIAFTHTGMASAHSDLARYAEAETSAKRALQELPRFPAALRALIVSQALAGKVQEARESLVTYLQVDPTARLSNMRERFLGTTQRQTFERILEGFRLAGMPE